MNLLSRFLAPAALLALLAGNARAVNVTLVETGGTFRTDAVNLAASAQAIGLNQYGGPHLIAHINDGLYGNSQSWLGQAASTDGSDNASYNSWVGVSFSTPVTIASFAFGRDNTGFFQDRASGTFWIEVNYGAVDNPDLSPWQYLTFLDYSERNTVDRALRNLYELETPLEGVTGFRITTQRDLIYTNAISGMSTPLSTGQVIDELEIYATSAVAVPEPASFATLAGLGAIGCALSRRRAHRKQA